MLYIYIYTYVMEPKVKNKLLYVFLSLYRGGGLLEGGLISFFTQKGGLLERGDLFERGAK